jgi:hypothetical protein
LIATQYPTVTNEQLKNRLLYGADRLTQWQGVVSTGGRLNVFRSLEDDRVAPSAAADLSSHGTGISRVTMGWTAPGDDGRTGRAAAYDLRWSETPISEDGADGTVIFGSASAVDTGAPQTSGSPEHASWSVVPSGQERVLYVALRTYDNVGNPSPLASARVRVPAARVLFEDKGGDKTWTADVPWALAEEPGRGQVWSSAPGGQQDNNANVSLTSQPIDLGAAHGSTLMFNAKRELENRYDHLIVEASEDGVAWTELSNQTGNEDWTAQTMDLSAFDGKQARLRFRVQTDGSVPSKGVKIDDVVIAAAADLKA